MRRVAVLIVFLFLTPAIIGQARSVHSTEALNMFPQGNMEDSTDWEFKRHLAFTPENKQEDAEYVMGMVADSHMTLGIELPEHLDTQTVWATQTSTDSNASLGSPDGAYSWSTGPDITVGGFYTGSMSQSTIESVELVVHFDIPGPLTQDKARFSVINGGVYDLVKTWSNTQSPLYYMTNGWSTEIFDDDNWTFEELESLEIDLDYVSNGNSDDSQIQVDAVGLRVTMRTQWYGAERVTATSSNNFTDWPLINFNKSHGTLSDVSYAPCGLSADYGTWETDSLEKPSGQTWGRIHVEHDNENGSVNIQYMDNQGAWVTIQPGLIPAVSGDLKIRFTITDTCLTRAWIDINDPHLKLTGSISGDIDSMVENSTRWTVVVNGVTVANYPGTELGSFAKQISIGHTLDSADTELEVKIKSWYNWGNDGSPASLTLSINSIEVIGAYSIEYDEDPQCSTIGSHDLIEDGGGLILPLLTRCSDDRTESDELSVTFQNSNPDIVEVDITEGQIRIKLIEEASGVAQITTRVTDSAGNFWSEISTITIQEVDDAPVLKEFQAVIPVEHGYEHRIRFELTDVDSFNEDLIVTTNRSWAEVDMSEREIVVNAPTPGFTSILVTACDETSCVERIIDLEVRALAELFVEEIRIDEDVNAGEIFQVKVFVRNSGQVTATMIGVRCTADGQSFGSGMIQMLQPGQMGSIVCDMQAPSGDDSLLIEAEVDRGTSIDEVDENNNVASKVVAVGAPIDNSVSSEDEEGFSIGQGTVYIIAGGALLAIIALFGLLAPAKIKKLE